MTAQMEDARDWHMGGKLGDTAKLIAQSRNDGMSSDSYGDFGNEDIVKALMPSRFIEPSEQ
ncbi:unnamed protein product [Fusarium fujikuroi]|uniref:Uncharacterized protein n=1 Tax=Fusarium fujikuroi TaxID=5127 RepID=A0A9Q9RU47_FUSFU|nr:uncharacterized protein FFE2_05773 [Fusarium fujikuroi]VTT70878.1 unnamed protein product [Fusarium fujikuroi]VTT71652.1 unnamed protein product [Fusarium fujikuroi]VZI21647.1 unnamed protein product [Fusarium fujikuroi]